MRALGIVPARGGSRGLPGKNLMPIGGKSLVRRAIESGRASKLLTNTVVSTDDDWIYNEAERCRAPVYARPPHLATDTAGMLGVLQHVAEMLAGYDLIVCLQPTSPFRTGAMIDATIQKVLDTGADSAQTVTEAPYSPYYMSTLDGDLLHDLFADGHKYVYRQACPPVYMPNGAVYVTRRETLMTQGRIRGHDHRAVVCGFGESINIDTIWDYRLAELIAKERG